MNKRPVMLPLTSDIQRIKQALEICGGFLFTGGQDDTLCADVQLDSECSVHLESVIFTCTELLMRNSSPITSVFSTNASLKIRCLCAFSFSEYHALFSCFK